jgi:hypothetical protein
MPACTFRPAGTAPPQRYTLLVPSATPAGIVAPVGPLYGSQDTPRPGGQVLSWETGAGKSYLIPAIEVPAFTMALSGVARLALPNDRENGKRVYQTTPSTFFDNVAHESWQFDRDSFAANNIRHPYQGSIYYGFARSAGLGYWTSSFYAFMGSYLWETGGETTKPSINDQIMSGVAGAFFGESLFRLASLVLEGGGESPGFWRELGAAFISPPTGLNRFIFGEQFSPVFPSRDPAVFWRLDLGGSVITNSTGHVTGVPQEAAVGSFSLAYGLPGKPGYDYERPFDYFQVELAANSGPTGLPAAVTTRGLLLGSEYEVGETYRGIWGLYGSYEYISPETFRVSTAAVAIGTTAQWWLSRLTTLQFSALAGGGYGAAGPVPGAVPDYHHGGAAQGLLGVRLIFGDLAMLEFAQRQYYICQFGSGKPPGNELLGRSEAGLTVRISGRHAVALKFLAATRDEYVPNAHNRQTMETITLSYTLLSDKNFGAVDWRDAGQR